MNVLFMANRTTRLLRLFFICGLLSAQNLFAQDIKILINHLGYETDGPKRAVILGHAGDDVTAFKIIDTQSGKEVSSGSSLKIGPVDHWKDWIFWTADFSGVTAEGNYVV